MIEIGQAQKKVLEEVPIMGTERIHILDSLQRVLAQDIQARRDVPSADNSAMDGYAVRHEDIEGASFDNPAMVTLVGEAPAGKLYEGSVGAGQAVRILTGGVVPQGADSVIMVEDTSLEGDQVKINEGLFANHEGVVETVDKKSGHVVVMIKIFGRPTPVELEYWQVEVV